MNTTFETKKAYEKVTEKSAIWLFDNYHKFSQYNKIKVALALLARAVPTQLEHSGEIKGAETRIILVNPKQVSEKTGIERIQV